MVIPAQARLTARRALAPKRTKHAKQELPDPIPVVKWAGGKTRLLDELTAAAPGSYRRYHEPFLGGGALFFRLRPQSAHLADCNTDLINMYRCVAWNVEAVIRRLAHHRRSHSDEYYYKARTRWNERTAADVDVDRAALFLYLNKTCYNGLWRVNSKGQFNVPVGRYDSPQIYDPLALRAAAVTLQKATLTAGNYADAADRARAGDFVYFDPPYHPVTSTANFTSYTAQCFSEDDQRQLAELARALDRRGCAVVLSNSDTPLIRCLYRGFRMRTVKCSRAINSNASRRGEVNELIIANEF